MPADKKIDQEALNDSARILAIAFLADWNRKHETEETTEKEKTHERHSSRSNDHT